MYKRWSAYQPMFTSIPGWNVDVVTGTRIPPSEMSKDDQDLSMLTLFKHAQKRKAAASGMGPATKQGGTGVPNARDDSAHPV